MNSDPLKAWHRIVATRDVQGLDALLADEAVFHSPVVHTPQVGKPITKKYLVAAFLLATMLFTTVAQAMEIQQFDKMAVPDQGDYVGLLIGGAEQVLNVVTAGLTLPQR